MIEPSVMLVNTEINIFFVRRVGNLFAAADRITIFQPDQCPRSSGQNL